MAIRIDHLVSHEARAIDADSEPLQVNLWTVGDDRECLVIDPLGTADEVLQLIGARTVVGVVCTHAIAQGDCADDIATRTGAPLLMHERSTDEWHAGHPDAAPIEAVDHEDVISVGGSEVTVLVTPGHTLGSICLWVPELRAVFTGATLHATGPQAVDRAGSDQSTVEYSVRKYLFPLGDDVAVNPALGPSTTIGAQRDADWAQ